MLKMFFDAGIVKSTPVSADSEQTFVSTHQKLE